MNAYSRLKQILIQQHLSVPELHRRIRSKGYHVNVKSLYRLSDENQPLERLDMRVAGAVCQVCTVPLSAWIVFEEEGAALRALTLDKQQRLDALMAGSNAGSLNEGEKDELRTLVREAEEITVANARLLAAQHNRLVVGGAEAVSHAA